MSRPEAKWTSTAGTATVFGQREMLSGESRLNARPRGGLFLNFFRFGNAPTHASPVCAVGPGNR